MIDGIKNKINYWNTFYQQLKNYNKINLTDLDVVIKLTSELSSIFLK